MTPFIVSILIMYFSWWMLSTEFQKYLYSEWTQTPFSTWDHIKGILPHIFKKLSPQNIHAQGFVDGEVKLLNQRRSLMLFSFQRLAVIFPGLILCATLQVEIFVSIIVVATILLALFFKRPGRVIQIAFLAGVFFMSYQWCFYQASQWIFAPVANEFIYTMADAKILTTLSFILAGLIITFLVRFEFWSLWLGSILFFAGGLAYLNLFGLLLGESLGWGLYWFFLSKSSSRKNQTIQRELFFLTFAAIFLFMFALAWFKSLGFLDIRIMSPIISKKLILLIGWALWEIFLSLVLMLWGHFRSRSAIVETSDLEIIKLPLSVLGQGFFGYRGWLPDQIQYRRGYIERRLISLEASEIEISANIPPVLRQKTLAEVESLKRLLGALPKNSV